MTSSLETILALATQGTYTAANNFLELFARYRRRQGLPASTTSFGLITDLGHQSTNSTTIALMARNRVLKVSEHQCLTLIEPAFLNNDVFSLDKAASPCMEAIEDPLSLVGTITCLDPAQMVAQGRAEIEGSSNIPRWYSDGRVSLVMRAFEDALRHQNEGAENNGKGRDDTSPVALLRKQFGELIKSDGSERKIAESFVVKALVDTVAEMLFIESSAVDPAKTVAHYGVDSLIAAELRNWFNTAFRAEISMLDLLDTRTSMRTLASMIVEGALAKAAS